MASLEFLLKQPSKCTQELFINSSFEGWFGIRDVTIDEEITAENMKLTEVDVFTMILFAHDEHAQQFLVNSEPFALQILAIP